MSDPVWTNAVSLTSGAGTLPQQAVEIDEILVNLASLDQQVEHLKELKRHRAAVIDAEIERLETLGTQLRDSIRQFMRSTGDKTLKFPGVGSVTRKPGTARWVIKDEDALIAYLRSDAGLSPQSLAEVLVTKETISKAKLNKVLDDLAKHGALKTDAVEKQPSEESISVSFDKGDALKLAAKERSAQSAIPAAVTSVLPATPPAPSVAAYDELELG